MQIWMLRPTGDSSPDWEASSYRGEVIVRAESETKARQIAMRAFVLATRVNSGNKLMDVPWNQSALVSASLMQNSTYQDAGIEELLGPPEALRIAGG
jgi:hypothetical protein